MVMLRVDIKLWPAFNQLRIKMQKRSFDVLLIIKTSPITLWEMAKALAPDPRLDIQTASHFLHSSLVHHLYENGLYFCSFLTKPIKHTPSIHPNAFSSFYCTITHEHYFSRHQNKTFYSIPTPFTHRQLKHYKLQKLQTHTVPCREASRNSAVKPCCANFSATDPQKKILSYKILYQILNSWTATLLTFHFPETVQHNFVSKFHTHSSNRANSPKNLHQHQLTTPEEDHQHNHHESNHLKRLHILWQSSSVVDVWQNSICDSVQ